MKLSGKATIKMQRLSKVQKDEMGNKQYKDQTWFFIH